MFTKWLQCDRIVKTVENLLKVLKVINSINECRTFLNNNGVICAICTIKGCLCNMHKMSN